jgi:hypothetical protein
LASHATARFTDREFTLDAFKLWQAVTQFLLHITLQANSAVTTIHTL